MRYCLLYQLVISARRGDIVPPYAHFEKPLWVWRRSAIRLEMSINAYYIVIRSKCYVFQP